MEIVYFKSNALSQTALKQNNLVFNNRPIEQETILNGRMIRLSIKAICSTILCPHGGKSSGTILKIPAKVAGGCICGLVSPSLLHSTWSDRFVADRSYDVR